MEQEILPPLKRKAGRPHGTKIKIDYERVEQLAGRGMTQEQIARCIGIGETTFYKRIADDKKFKEALDKGTAIGIAAVTAELFKNIKAGNMTGIIFYLKCKAGWKETSIIETRNLDPLPAENCSPEEAEAAYAAAMRLVKG